MPVVPRSARSDLRARPHSIQRTDGASPGVTASSSGILSYESMGSGSGACFLTCHGVDHDPLGYGAGFDSKGLPLMPEMWGREAQPGSPRRLPDTRVAPSSGRSSAEEGACDGIHGR